MKKNLIGIVDRQKDYEQVIKIMQWLELGMRAISIMYDEYSSDKNSKENIFRLKDNIAYRLISAEHMYRLLLIEVGQAEQFLRDKEYGRNNIQFLAGSNPYMTVVEPKISAVFDSVVFNLVSVFDYISHIICYICKTQKSETFYWTKLAKAVRNKNSDLGKSDTGPVVDQMDRDFVGKLYNYRSTLIHNHREKHPFSIDHNLAKGTFNVKILMTGVEMKDFKFIYKDHDENDSFTLPFLASCLIKTSAIFIEAILDSLYKDISADSHYYHNIRGAKGMNRPVMLFVDPATNMGSPIYEQIWKQFKDANPFNAS
ncbi:MAG TPA: hypothetical protein VIL78_17250 [Hanamia sp.]